MGTGSKTMIPENYLFRWMLHKVNPGPVPQNSFYTVPEAAFRDMARRIESLHPGKILYTFDDGNSTDLEVSLPILEEIGAESRSYFFISTAWIGKEGRLTKAQLRQLASRSVSVGTHGHTHNFFDRLKDKRLAEELSVSRQIVEEVTGRPVDALSVPGGKFDDRLTGLALTAGYKKIFTSYPWDKEIGGIRYLGRYCIHRKNLVHLPRIYSLPVFSRIFLVLEYIGKTNLRDLLSGKFFTFSN
jgi:peptidoglycan/xylan/chitin deacetylase (PgdA/CDA1 family)